MTGSSFGNIILPPTLPAGITQQNATPSEQTAALIYMRRLQEDERHRILLNYYAFYRGTHYSYIRDISDPQMVINYTRAFIDKGVSFTFANGFTFVDAEGEAKSPELDVINDFWTYNNKDEFCINMGTNGGISGNAFVKVTYDPVADHIVFVNLDTNCCFPVFKPGKDDEFSSFKIEYIISVGATGDFNDYHLYTELYTEDQVTILLDGQTISSGPNPFGFIPIVNAVNKKDPLTSYGIPDCVDQIALQRIFNEQVMKMQDIVNYHAAPITVITGARLQNLVVGARKTWSGLPLGATVQNLTLDSDLPALQNFIDRLKVWMHEVTSTPVNVFGQEQAISNTSNAALQTQYLPLIDKTNVKRINYGKALRRINNYALRIWDIVHQGQTINPDFVHDIRWESPLPKDEERLIQQIVVPMLQARLIDRVEGLRILGYKDPEKMVAAADADAQKQAQMAAQAAGQMAEASAAGQAAGTPADQQGPNQAQQTQNPDNPSPTDSQTENQNT